MNTLSSNRGLGLVLGVAAAVALVASATRAIAQDSHNDHNGGGFQQAQPSNNSGNQQDPSWNSGGGYRQDQSGNHGHQWGEMHADGSRVYHQQPSFFYHRYNGPEHRRYYTYQGREFYLNLDTNIRIEL
jgi:hypothetical protein